MLRVVKCQKCGHEFGMCPALIKKRRARAERAGLSGFHCLDCIEDIETENKGTPSD